MLQDKLAIATIARQAIRDIGYTVDEVGLCADTCKVELCISQAIQDVFDMHPAAIVERFNWLRPIYRATAAYGYVDRPEFPWEASDCVVA